MMLARFKMTVNCKCFFSDKKFICILSCFFLNVKDYLPSVQKVQGLIPACDVSMPKNDPLVK